ncbi:hypothetical protein [Ruegeria arenilitoris]|uniref:hypothetical protein n=1 Tax=Ruegeria arenilitoris TaxID=1173585 RepID=UPI001481483B|nr:hypothetical protein [Ruegeria arenilitoris]
MQRTKAHWRYSVDYAAAPSHAISARIRTRTVTLLARLAQDKAKARPTPPLGVRFSQSPLPEEACQNSSPQDCLNTTPEKLQLVVENLSQLRDAHRLGPLQAGTVELFQLDYVTAIEPTLIMEAALKR